MTPQKLAVLLTAFATVGQFTILAAHSAAQSDSPVSLAKSLPYASDIVASAFSPVGKPLEIASIMGKSDSIPATSGSGSDVLDPDLNPGEFLTVVPPTGGLKTVIQVLPQSSQVVSLLVNGSEIVRLSGDKALSRVSIIAKRLHTHLSANAALGGSIEPSASNAQHVVIGQQPLITIDPVTASTAHETPERMAYQVSNRFRAALGYVALTTPMPGTVIASTDDATAKKVAPRFRVTGKRQTGVASWYGGIFHGRRTASGARFNQYGMTAAHRTLPFGTMVRVVNKKNNESCLVKITDRGPYAHGRIIDLSKGAAQKIHMSGTAKVVLEMVAVSK